MRSLYLRLAAPVQSWAGQKVTGNVVPTGPHPTVSGLRGLLAACMGWTRGAWEPWIEDVELTIRVDDPGVEIDEFQTINPRDEDLDYQRRMQTIVTGRAPAGGKASPLTPDGDGGTAIVRRTYLASAEFLVEISAGQNTGALRRAIREPKFVPYLGRKAFSPTFPFFLGAGPGGLLDELPTVPAAEDPLSASSSRSPAPERHGTDSETRSLEILTLTPAAPGRTVNVPAMTRAAWLDAVGERLAR